MTRRPFVIALIGLSATFLWCWGPEPRGGLASLWPSVLAVGLAFLTRDIYLSLFAGALSGALLLHHGHPAMAFHDVLMGRLIPSLTDRWNICVLVFTLMMGGLVEVLNRNGGMASLSARTIVNSRSPRRVGLSAYAMGWLLFFDGLASAMLVGKALRPAADRARLSREKLAFIVDSTSSPIAGLAVLSTWVAYEMSVIRQGLEQAGNGTLVDAVAPFSWLVLSLPYRFYNWYILALVLLIVWLMRDWGPMLQAERASRKAPNPSDVSLELPLPIHASRVHMAWIPLVVLIVGVFGGLMVGGGGLKLPFTLASLVEAFGKADAAGVFVVATAGATVVALALSATMPSANSGVASEGGTHAFFHGMQQMFLPALILVFAWMLNSVLKELGAAQFLVACLGRDFPVAWLPALVFLLASVISFSTGTSWGTMAIVMPLTVPLAVNLTGFQTGMPAGQVLLATVGAVLAGAVFGDHCSPISDTTIVSAFSCECDVMAHVRTQLPYALAAAVMATFLGYLPAGYGVHPGVTLLGGLALCWLLVRYAFRRADDA